MEMVAAHTDRFKVHLVEDDPGDVRLTREAFKDATSIAIDH
jgi:hypothetical protein